MAYRYRDAYVKKAQKQDKLARSYYKLAELNQRLKLFPFPEPWRVLDLGAAPGSWSQWLCEQFRHPDSRVVAIDLKPLKWQHSQVIAFQEDLRHIQWDQVPWKNWVPFHAVLSDMMASTSGIRDIDQARSFELGQLAWEVAQKTLISGGSWIVKVFDQPALNQWLQEIKPFFHQLVRQRPEAVRSTSSEVYIVGLGFKSKIGTIP